MDRLLSDDCNPRGSVVVVSGKSDVVDEDDIEALDVDESDEEEFGIDDPEGKPDENP